MSADPTSAIAITWRRSGVYQFAFLGPWIVAEAWPCWQGRGSAQWRMRLPGLSEVRINTAPNLDAAIEIVERKVGEWIDLAGLAPAIAASAPLRAAVGGREVAR